MLNSIVVPMVLGFMIFMLGLKAMELTLHRSVGHHLQTVLEQMTATPLHGLLIGTATTAVLQSSTAVTVMTIGLVNAGLLTFPRTLGIILGTNIGTCLTTELIGLNISKLGWPLLLISLGCWFVTVLAGELGLGTLRRTKLSFSQAGLRPSGSRFWPPVRSTSVVVGGFALLLIGMALMQSVAPAVEASSFFSAFLGRAEGSVIWGIAAGAVLTAAVHSGAAVIAIIMGLAAVSAMPVPIGIAIVLGANIGTCVTALLVSYSGSKAGRFVAWSHVVLNVGGAVLFAPFTRELQAVVAMMTTSPAAQIAHAQTIFNIACSLLALPLCYLPKLRRMKVQ
ncbi:phosphate:Na+ symporter [Paenibacillus phyllosphaerae]|uniref:Phosphate:Na+ symporter n=1 Tax=Paenibacillus phyllosphaerae TaxID=274593 RepID=A0A7W5AUE3_9BACL|nr:Na/Pi symporter [Paenibacillus phyllosphaerae]MBB3108975.1 phosphate:Na+ symporter [Paenibacillus phyllosphaerae]